MEFLIALAGLIFLGVAVMMLLRGLMFGRSSETVEQIGAYGFTGSFTAPSEKTHDRSIGRLLDRLADWLGTTLGERVTTLRERELRSRLVAAGMYTVTPRRLIGYQLILAAASGLFWFWLAGLQGVNAVLAVIGAVVAVGAGWVLPLSYVDYRRRTRRNRIERDLPDLIDLLVVTIEAGLSFNQGLRFAAERMRGPLAQELRLTLQEQNMGLTLTEGLRNLLSRADTPGVRSFVRAITQGETLGVSTGQIMRNLADEMRKKRKAAAEERAQKAPVKILFPLLLLIFPAIFVVLLLPALMRISDVLG